MTTSLPEPSFIERDGAKILAECVELYETLTGKPLEPGSVERLLIDVFVYRELQIRIAIQEAALQCLPAYARFPMIDHLARIGGVPRLSARAAKTTHRWTLPAVLGIASAIPAGSRIGTRDTKAIFTTDVDTTIAAGSTFVDVATTCTSLGPIGNGYAAGQVDQVLDSFGFTVSASNTTQTDGGSAAEDSDGLRDRLPIAVRGSSVGGPEDAYRSIARAAHPDIIDVSVTSPTPGIVRLAVLTRTGIASAPILALVLAAASPKTVRPICDAVEAVSAAPVDYALTVQLTLRTGVNTAERLAAVTAKANAYVAERAAGLERSLVLSQIVTALSLPGVYRVSVVAPVVDTTITALQWARCTAVTVTVVGYASGP